MMKPQFFSFSTLFLLTSTLCAGYELGPTRLCRCLPSSLSSSDPSVQLYSHLGHGVPELCYCFDQAIDPSSSAHSAHTQNTLADSTLSSSSHSAISADSSSGSSVSASAHAVNAATASSTVGHNVLDHDMCAAGLTLDANFTMADWGSLSMCSMPVGTNVYNAETTVNLNENQYACGHFRFELRNGFGPSGLSFYAVVHNISYAAVAPDSPPLPKHIEPLRTYATWVFQSCNGVTLDMMQPAKHIADLENGNEQFANLARFGARPVGVQSGNVYPGGLQCVLVENPWCHLGE